MREIRMGNLTRLSGNLVERTDLCSTCECNLRFCAVDDTAGLEQVEAMLP